MRRFGENQWTLVLTWLAAGVMIASCDRQAYVTLIPETVPSASPMVAETVAHELISTPPTSDSAKDTTPTETLVSPGSISAEKLLAECSQKLEVSGSLTGSVLIGGHYVLLDYPRLTSDIILCLHPSLVNQDRPWPYVAFDGMYINSRFLGWTEVNPTTQLMAEYWYYGHYAGWLHDQDNRYWNERKDISFTDYLGLVAEGGDGSHSLWVNTESGPIYPKDQVSIDPMTTRFMPVFGSTTYGFGAGFSRYPEYDTSTDTLVWPMVVTYGGHDPEEAKAWPYLIYTASLEHMGMPGDVQRYGYGDVNSSNPMIQYGKVERGWKWLEPFSIAYAANQHLYAPDEPLLFSQKE